MMIHQESHMFDQGNTCSKSKYNFPFEIDRLIRKMYEHPLTCKLKISKIRKFVQDLSLQVPQWPCHKQSIGRSVKQVTEASGKVYISVFLKSFLVDGTLKISVITFGTPAYKKNVKVVQYKSIHIYLQNLLNEGLTSFLEQIK